jgi:hypothetical protein
MSKFEEIFPPLCLNNCPPLLRILQKKVLKNALFNTVTFSCENIKKDKLHIDQKYLTKQFEIFHQLKHTSFISTYFLTARFSKLIVTAAFLSMKVKKN